MAIKEPFAVIIVAQKRKDKTLHQAIHHPSQIQSVYIILENRSLCNMQANCSPCPLSKYDAAGIDKLMQRLSIILKNTVESSMMTYIDVKGGGCAVQIRKYENAMKDTDFKRTDSLFSRFYSCGLF